MYNANKLELYQKTANLLNAASSYREVLLPVSEVAQQFSELLNEVKKNEKTTWKADENGFEATAEKKATKGGKKAKE